MKTKAVILAAGFGSRMKEYTKDLPKPMLQLDGRPLIEYTIRQLIAHGIKEIAINLHYQGSKISDFFGDGEKFGATITYIYEDAPSGTAGGVKKLSSHLSNADNIIVIYGDIITDIDYSHFLSQHIKNQCMATICVHKRKTSNSIVEFGHDKKVLSFIERPDLKTLEKYTDGIWVNSAIYCFKREILDLIKDDVLQDFPKDIFPVLIPKMELYAYELFAKRYAIDSIEKYLEANSEIKNFKFSF